MSKKFLIAVDSPTAAESDALTNSLKDTKYGYWHWIADIWIIDDPTSEAEVVKWRSKVRELIADRNVIVIELQVIHWAVSAPEDSHQWLLNHLKSH